jgi:hypothetical protein
VRGQEYDRQLFCFLLRLVEDSKQIAGLAKIEHCYRSGEITSPMNKSDRSNVEVVVDKAITNNDHEF